MSFINVKEKKKGFGETPGGCQTIEFVSCQLHKRDQPAHGSILLHYMGEREFIHQSQTIYIFREEDLNLAHY